ncbi:MAG TPA: hypothetical protein VKB23_02555 [Solirubrobacterales bacterium]|nr:hypothetical protein [Solirubrobacterales bacterium]
MLEARRGLRAVWILTIALLGCLAMGSSNAVAQELNRISNFGPDGTDATNFTLIGSIGIDQLEGTVYVLDEAGELHKFSGDGQPLNFGGSSLYITENRIDGLSPYTIALTGTLGVAQVAVNSQSHVVYVTEQHAVRAFQGDGEPAEFTAGPGAGTSELPGFGELFGVALDDSGNIYASDRTGSIKIFTPAGALITTVPASIPHNIAVSASGAIYVIEEAKRVKKLTPDSVPVSGSTIYTETSFIPAHDFAMTSLAVDASSQDVYVLESSLSKGWIRRFDPSGALEETIGEPGTPGEAEALGGRSQGIAVLDQSEEVEEGIEVELYAADTPEEGESQVALFGVNNPPGAPEVQLLRVTDITSDSAILRASVNPNSRPTTYHFEYGLDDCSVDICNSLPLDGSDLGEGHEMIAVSQNVLGLAPATTYHYRVLASNELGSDKEDGVFTTQGIGGDFELSDDRAWEMVSPPNKGGATLRGPRAGMIQAAEDGHGLAYLSFGSIDADPDGNRNLEASSVIALRNGGGDWTSQDITPANSRIVPVSIGGKSEYKVFTPDLARGLLEPRDGTSLSPAASERTPYLRDNTVPPTYIPLVTGKEGFANVPLGTKFGGNPNVANGDVRVMASNKALTNVVLSSVASLIPGQPDAPSGLYHWKAGDLQPISLLPSSESSEGEEPIAVNFPGSASGSTWHAISEDGSRVFWGRGSYSNAGNNLTALYLRDTEAGKTVRLDVPESDASGDGASKPAFQGASPDGTAVFFTDTRQLTADASPSGTSLYRCEIPEGSPELGCATLSNVSPKAEGSGESAQVIGLVAGLGESGSTAYFVARGALDSSPNQIGEAAIPGEPNLYRWQEGDDIRFIASLSEEDSAVWGVTPRELTLTPGETAKRISTTSPSGRFLAFMSQRSLTGQENLDANSVKPVQTVFLYDAATDKLECISCNPSGAAPNGETINDGSSPLIDPLDNWHGSLVAAILPEVSTMNAFGISAYQPRAVFDSGRVFINVVDSVVPADQNGDWDVYQFEPIGVGDCHAISSNPSTVRSGGGCIGLISSGTAGQPAGFLDASESGNDVFFLTPAPLSVLDKDSDLDIYDARLNGVAAKLTPNLECSDQNCRSTAIPPANSSLGSAIFTGPGNVRQGKKCRKGKHKVRSHGKTRCVTKKKKGHAGSRSQSTSGKGQS